MVIFLTDGQPTIGTTDESQILAQVKAADNGKTRVFCFGIGTDVNTHLLDGISEVTRGFSQYVLPEEDLEVKISSFYSKIKEPVLSDPKLKFTGDIRVTKLYPSPLPDLFKGEQLVLVGRYSGHGASAVVIEGRVNGSERKFTADVKFTEDSTEHEFIPRLWATRRVGYLLDEVRLHGENSELRDEVTELARKYGIVTPYTAYLIMEDEGRRNVPMASRSLQQFDQDAIAKRAAKDNWEEFKNERAGDKAVASARYGLALKNADASAPANAAASVESEAAMFNRRYALNGSSTPAPSAAPAEAGRVRLAEYAQQSQFVAGKNFFQNNRQWVDSDVQKKADAKRTRVQFGSKEYFDLAANNSRARPWLALGQNVVFTLDDQVYEVYE